MKMTFTLRAAALALTLALGMAAFAPQAGAMVTRNNMQVLPLGGAEFEVRFKAGRSVQDYWCAAAQFARRQMTVNDPTTRIWRVSPPPRRQGEGIVFSLAPDRAAGSTGILSLGGPRDGSMSVASSEQQCDDLTRRWRN